MKKFLIPSVAVLGLSLFNFQANAMEEFTIDNDGKKIFTVQYYDVADKTKSLAEFFGETEKGFRVLNYNLQPNIKAGLNDAFKMWAEILGPDANILQPAKYFVGTFDVMNADAQSLSLVDGKISNNPNLFREIFQNGRIVKDFSNLTNENEFKEMDTGEVAFGFIRIGENLGINENDGNFGWSNPSYFAYPVAQSMRNIDIAPVMFHEIGHSLGFLVDANDEFGTIQDDDKNEWKILTLGSDADNPKSFTNHLRNNFGDKPQAGTLVLMPEMLESKQLQKDFAEKFDGKNLTADDVFFVEDVNMTTKTKSNGRVFLYFEGDNVTEVLDGKTFTRGDGEEISGLPLSTWENFAPEMSHSNLARSMMSHQNYRSYNNFLEAELALLQDIGYKIDRKNFYGKSIYTDNQTFVNWQSFSARENGEYVDGYNTATLGVGLHIYGSNNDIIQRGNIFTKGYGGAGIRVDGLKDKITLAKDAEIHADGEYGVGILVAYGKNHELNIDGTITANGFNGHALHFDFGANMMGANTEYRGSFIRYMRLLSEGQPAIVKNIGLNEIVLFNDDFSFTDLDGGDLNGALIDNVNISGKLFCNSENGGRAIFIEEESFVKNININAGAEIVGDIVSEWKKFNPEEYGIFDKETKLTYPVRIFDKQGNPRYDSRGNVKTKKNKSVAEPLVIQYNDKNYIYTAYIPDLVTNLNFNSDIKFAGKISGDDNLKLNLNGGNLNFSGGAADVVNVNVASGAKVTGGNFTVNDMAEKIAEGFSDEDSGKFINHGTISAEAEDFVINGDLISDGVLQVQRGKKIIVNGVADLSGAKIEVLGAEKNIPIKILTAEKIICENIKLPDDFKFEVIGNDLILTCE